MTSSTESNRCCRGSAKACRAGLNLHAVGDQSVFVKAAIFGVLREAVLAAALVGLMILLFLGSWRSTVIIIISIPLSILFSVTLLSMLGETINVMTLGGLALAVGMLVDEGTVTWRTSITTSSRAKTVEPAILDGAQQIVVPAFVTLLVLDIVFAPMFQLGGVAGYLFRPLAEAVVFALIGSFILSRTLVPTMARFLLQAPHRYRRRRTTPLHRAAPSRNPFKRFQQGFERRLYMGARPLSIDAGARAGSPKTVIVGFVVLCYSSRSGWGHSWARTFPAGGFRPNPDARARPAGHAHRGDGPTVRLHRADRSPHHPARPARQHRRQYRLAVFAASTWLIRTPARSGRKTAMR